jgi:uncharacterized membrane protein YkoI
MSQKTAFIIAATITTFLFVLAGGFMASFAAPAAASQQPVAASVSATSVDVQVLQQREQQYQQLLAEANRRLAQAYAQNTAVPVVTATAAPQVASQPVYPISPNQAAVIALNAAPGSNLQQIPGLVDLQGTVAYQVMLDNGQVYVDANTGQILFNSTAAPLQTGRGHGDDGGTFGNEGSDGDGN